MGSPYAITEEDTLSGIEADLADAHKCQQALDTLESEEGKEAQEAIQEHIQLLTDKLSRFRRIFRV